MESSYQNYSNHAVFLLSSSCDESTKSIKLRKSELVTWNKRLGHPSSSVLTYVLKSCNKGLKINESPDFCKACQFGKFHALPFNTSPTHASNPLYLIHTDV